MSRPLTKVPPRERAFAAALCAALILLNAAWVASVLGWVHGPRRVLEGDHFRYLEMARGAEGKPELARLPPYCWRVLAPWLAQQLSRAGPSLNLAFYLVTNAFLFGFLLILYLYLRSLGFGMATATAGVVLAALMQGAVRWYEYQYWMSDPPALFFFALAFLLVRQGRWLALGLASFPAVLARENYVIVFVYGLLHVAREQGWRVAAARMAAVAAGPVALLVLVRRLIVPIEPDDLVASVADTLGFRWRHLADNQAYVLTVGSFGVLFPLMLLLPERLGALARRHYDQVAVLVLAYATLTVANNTERMLAYALPVVLPAALWAAETFGREARVRVGGLLLAAIALQLLFFTRLKFHGEPGLSLYQPSDALVMAAMTGFWLAAQVVRRLRRSRPQ